MSTDFPRLKDSAAPEMRELLADAAPVSPMTPADREAILAGALVGGTAIGAGVTQGGSLLSTKALVLVGSLFAIGAVGVVALRTPAPVVVEVLPATTASSPAVVTPPEPSAAPAPIEELPTVPTPRPPIATKRLAADKPAAEHREEDTLAAESALVGTARARLDPHPSEAVGLLQEHARRFPRGDFAPERDFLLVKALRRLGRTEEALRIARGYGAKHPSSPYVTSVQTILQELEAP